MVLVDTSVLIDFINNKNTDYTEQLNMIISNRIPYGINAFIYQEILQGAASEKDFNILNEYLSTQKVYELKNGLKSYADAARIFFQCRKKGFTVRSTVDLLIVQTAIENDLFLLHNDRDFTGISSVVKELKIFKA
jgi:predicted nucleic acid-binding protein